MKNLKQAAKKAVETTGFNAENYPDCGTLRAIVVRALQQLDDGSHIPLIQVLYQRFRSYNLSIKNFSESVMNHVFPVRWRFARFLRMATATKFVGQQWFETLKIIRSWLRKARKDRRASLPLDAHASSSSTCSSSLPSSSAHSATSTDDDGSTSAAPSVNPVSQVCSYVLANDLEAAATASRLLAKELLSLLLCLKELLGNETGAEREAVKIFDKLKCRYGKFYPAMRCGLLKENAASWDDLSDQLLNVATKNLRDYVAMLLWAFFDLNIK